MAMRILISNDDGMTSPVLPELIGWARKYGDVTCVVPSCEQSGRSQAIDFTRAVEIKQLEIADGVSVYAVDFTPADCVRFAVMGLDTTYDIVISGINQGYNLGDDIVYSGTCGAIFEGARMGIPGIALSSDFDRMSDVIPQLDGLFAWIERNRLLDVNPLYNVNFPHNTRGIRITKQGGKYFDDDFIHLEGNLYKQVGEPLVRDFTDNSLDIDAVQNGYISVTPLVLTRTQMSAFDKLCKADLGEI